MCSEVCGGFEKSPAACKLNRPRAPTQRQARPFASGWLPNALGRCQRAFMCGSDVSKIEGAMRVKQRCSASMFGRKEKLTELRNKSYFPHPSRPEQINFTLITRAKTPSTSLADPDLMTKTQESSLPNRKQIININSLRKQLPWPRPRRNP